MKIYIHIGISKTGTSAIQSFLNYNRERLLRDFSCLYPACNSEHPARGTAYHNHCPLFLRNERTSIINQLQKIIEYSKKERIEKIILSCEALYINPEHANLIFQVLNDHQDIRYAVIVYVRRQDYWFESAWKQWGLKNRKFGNIEEYTQANPLKWLEKLNKWAEVFGKENIIVHAYEKEQLKEGLLSDFLHILGIDYRNHEWTKPPESNLNENLGFNRDIIEILKLNQGFYKNPHDVRLFDFFSEYLSNDYMKKPFEKMALLSPGQRLKILEEYEPMNRIIARDYLGRSDGRLFYEGLPDPNEPWKPYEGLSIERIVPIFTQVLYNIDMKYRNQPAYIIQEGMFRIFPGLRKPFFILTEKIMKIAKRYI